MVWFTRDHIAEALELADRHHEHNERSGYPQYGEKVRTEPERRRSQRVGVVGEYLGAHKFKLPFNRAVGSQRAGTDLQIIEIRTRRIEPSRPRPDLAIRPDDKGELPNVLLRLDLAAGCGHFVGWLTAWQALERPVGIGDGTKEWCQAKGVWYVKPPYWSMASLMDYLGDNPMARPPRPLWMPWDFDARHPNVARQFPFAEPEEF